MATSKGGANFAVIGLRKKVGTLEAEVARLTAQNAKLAEAASAADGMRELEIKIQNGRLDVRERSEFMRVLAMWAGEFFISEGGKNYLEMSMHPSGPKVPPDFGELLLTFQRVHGQTPSMVAHDLKGFWNSRLRRVQPHEAKAGRLYLCLLSQAGVSTYIKTATVETRWLFGVCNEYRGDGGVMLDSLGFYACYDGGPFSGISVCLSDRPDAVEELYEVRDPAMPDPDRAPIAMVPYVLLQDFDYLAEGLNRFTGPGKQGEEKGAKGVLPRGQVVYLVRRPGPGGDRWRIVPEGWSQGVASFDTPEIPEYLDLLSKKQSAPADATEAIPETPAP